MAPPDLAAEQLRDQLAGFYSSERQAEEDADYYHLQLALIPILPGHRNGAWLYVEQALAEHPARPQTQQVWRLQSNGETLIARRYALAQPERFVRGWETGSLEQIDQKQLSPLAGCDLHVQQADQRTDALTGDAICRLDSTQVETRDHWIWQDDRLSRWERGFDRSGLQVRGPMNGPYLFDRAGQFAPLQGGF
ncbi:chromophore lyase CpcT/CpeT [Pseudomarimonas arenosa]|uniref:Chromophore lyase CpcT/CpeT n=1 Tax=Pseudomarimonas arenosa TaxID=2774145 RepID=A0AAW3ZKI2_9GAMM|nr:chromophore lyase CpcT/CpeT [Pseudomarimonas arenosa]